MCFSKQTFAHISKGCSIIPLAMDSRLGLDNSPTKPLWIGQFFISNTPNVHGGFNVKNNTFPSK